MNKRRSLLAVNLSQRYLTCFHVFQKTNRMLYVPASKMPPSFGIEYGRGRDLARGAEKNIASRSRPSTSSAPLKLR